MIFSSLSRRCFQHVLSLDFRSLVNIPSTKNPVFEHIIDNFSQSLGVTCGSFLFNNRDPNRAKSNYYWLHLFSSVSKEAGINLFFLDYLKMKISEVILSYHHKLHVFRVILHVLRSNQHSSCNFMYSMILTGKQMLFLH